MIPLPTIFAATAEKASLADALPHLMGFLVVLVTLIMLWAICAITGRVVRASFPEKEPSVRPTPSPVKTNEGNVSPEILTVIAAAVHASVGSTRRIVSVQPHNPAWNQAGRQQIYQSHKVR
ncbi:MAG: OadG family protein [Verrucomicrobiae bacterium]|nr:OadG family protein [Verrucomicrobiae bacterium]NNJ86789.1 OadG family protein [Akkermansiaceae bacterium]